MTASPDDTSSYRRNVPLLSMALDQATPDPENVSALLNAIPGAYEIALDGRKALGSDRTVRLEDL